MFVQAASCVAYFTMTFCTFELSTFLRSLILTYRGFERVNISYAVVEAIAFMNVGINNYLLTFGLRVLWDEYGSEEDVAVFRIILESDRSLQRLFIYLFTQKWVVVDVMYCLEILG